MFRSANALRPGGASFTCPQCQQDYQLVPVWISLLGRTTRVVTNIRACSICQHATTPTRAGWCDLPQSSASRAFANGWVILTAILESSACVARKNASPLCWAALCGLRAFTFSFRHSIQPCSLCTASSMLSQSVVHVQCQRVGSPPHGVLVYTTCSFQRVTRYTISNPCIKVPSKSNSCFA